MEDFMVAGVYLYKDECLYLYHKGGKRWLDLRWPATYTASTQELA